MKVTIDYFIIKTTHKVFNDSSAVWSIYQYLLSGKIITYGNQYFHNSHSQFILVMVKGSYHDGEIKRLTEKYIPPHNISKIYSLSLYADK